MMFWFHMKIAFISSNGFEFSSIPLYELESVIEKCFQFWVEFIWVLTSAWWQLSLVLHIVVHIFWRRFYVYRLIGCSLGIQLCFILEKNIVKPCKSSQYFNKICKMEPGTENTSQIAYQKMASFLSLFFISRFLFCFFVFLQC